MSRARPPHPWRDPEVLAAADAAYEAAKARIEHDLKRSKHEVASDKAELAYLEAQRQEHLADVALAAHAFADGGGDFKKRLKLERAREEASAEAVLARKKCDDISNARPKYDGELMKREHELSRKAHEAYCESHVRFMAHLRRDP